MAKSKKVVMAGKDTGGTKEGADSTATKRKSKKVVAMTTEPKYVRAAKAEKSRAKSKKVAATVKAKSKPKKIFGVKCDCGSKRIKGLVVDIESLDSETNKWLAERRRKLSEERQRKLDGVCVCLSLC